MVATLDFASDLTLILHSTFAVLFQRYKIEQNTQTKKMKKTFIWGVLILSAGAFIAKVLGAIYRIPLTNIIGAEGIGLYQMVFPLYSLLLVASSAGIPTAISRLVAEKTAQNDNVGAKLVFKSALILMLLLSGIASIIIFFLSGTFARLQGNTSATMAYYVISPAVIFSAVIASFRGYFQGRQNMVPTSISMCIEQVVKVIFGLYFANLWLPMGIPYGVMGAVLGVTISEIVTSIIMAIQYFTYVKNEKVIFKKTKTAFHFSEYKLAIIKVFKVALPITLGSLILPLTLLIDSMLIINILSSSGFTTQISTSLYGLETGVVNSLINFPAVISLSIATAIVPTLSSAITTGENNSVSIKTKLAIKIAWLIALPCFAGMLIFSDQIISVLYSGGLENTVIDEFLVAANLLKLSSISIIYIAFLQIFTATLQAYKKSYVPLVNLLIAVVLKVALNLILIPIPLINIQGAVIANIFCYFTACALNLLYLRKIIDLKINLKKFAIIPIVSAL
ncbi:MAG: polysaccharide biosynthesis protein, partial [Clostridia bacterium]